MKFHSHFNIGVTIITKTLQLNDYPMKIVDFCRIQEYNKITKMENVGKEKR